MRRLYETRPNIFCHALIGGSELRLRDALGHPRSTEHTEENCGPERSDRHNYAARLSRDGVNAFSLSPTPNSQRSNNRSVLLPF